MAGLTISSQLMAASTRFISWLESIPKAVCVCSAAGASSGRQHNGSKLSVISCLSGSQSAGLRRRVRSAAGVGPALDKRQRERKAYCYRQQFPTKGDKAVRAQSIRGRMALDGLYVSTNAPWLAEF